MNVILLAAGLGKRMKIDQPKQFLSINGKPMLAYSLEVFNSIDEVTKIVLVCQEDHIDTYKKIVENYKINKVEFVIGGSTRQESVYNGLKVVDSDRVILHEAARPLISKDFVMDLVQQLTNDVDCVVPVLPVNFTVAIGDEFMEGILDRSKLRNIQLPQVVKTDVLLDAHNNAIAENFEATEDSMMIYKYGGKVKFVDGRESNVKITTLYDVNVISNFLNIKNNG